MAMKRQQRWILAAVVSAIPAAFGASVARAQYPAPDDGHALDANNFQGSGGRNEPGKGATGNGQASGNQIVTGNVTGGRQFRGVVQYTDPQAFRGSAVGGISDSFVKTSYGSPQRNAPAFSLSAGRAFYGASRAVAPPVGALREGFSGGFVGTSFQSGVNNTSLASPLLALKDQRLGVVEIVGAPPGTVPQGNNLVLPPPGQEAGNLYVSSPLLGPRFLQSGVLGQVTTGTQPLPTGQLGTTELPGNGGVVDRFSTAIVPAQSAGSAGSTSLTPQPLNAPLNPTPHAPLGSPEGGGDVDSGIRQRLVVPAKEQSAQYKELQQRFNRTNSEHPPTAEEANRQFQQLRAEQAKGKQGGPPQQPGLAGQPGALQQVTPPAMPGRAKPEEVKPDQNRAAAVPLHVDSVASLAKSKDLRDILESAEKLMRDGQYPPAIEKFSTARKISRNEPLVSLGRAHAELGAGLYTRALFDLRRAFGAEPALVTSQYDLKSMLTAQRVEAIQKDLDSLSKNDVKSVEGPLLAAYVAHNIGDSAAAARHLQESLARVGSDDALLELMRTHWAVPEKQQELNK